MSERILPKPDNSIEPERTDRLKKMYFDLIEQNLNGFYQKAFAEAERLKEKYPGYGRVASWNILVGSSVDSDCREFDFPGKDSVEGWLERQMHAREESDSETKDNQA